jgi:hypothetical protein
VVPIAPGRGLQKGEADVQKSADKGGCEYEALRGVVITQRCGTDYTRYMNFLDPRPDYLPVQSMRASFSE